MNINQIFAIGTTLNRLPQLARIKVLEALNSPNQHKLYIYNTDLTNENLQVLVSLLPLTGITALSLKSCRIDDAGARVLAQITNITMLTLRHNQIGPDGAAALAQNETITMLRMHDNQVGSEGAKALALNTNMTYLNLTRNLVGPEGAKALAQNKNLYFLVCIVLKKDSRTTGRIREYCTRVRAL